MGLLSFSAVIPVIRPSERNPAEINAAAVKLVEKHGKGNSVAYWDSSGRFVIANPTSDQAWLRNVKAGCWWRDEDWNFDPGTTAHISIKWGDGVGAGYVGRIRFMKDGREIGMRALYGSRKYFGYYRDMAKLGIYIP